jgi:hypothetical protein
LNATVKDAGNNAQNDGKTSVLYIDRHCAATQTVGGIALFYSWIHRPNVNLPWSARTNLFEMNILSPPLL